MFYVILFLFVRILEAVFGETFEFYKGKMDYLVDTPSR